MIIARFFCNIYCSINSKIKNIKDNRFLKMSMYLFYIVNESKDKGRVTTHIVPLTISYN